MVHSEGAIHIFVRVRKEEACYGLQLQLLMLKEKHGGKLVIVSGECPEGADLFAKQVAYDSEITYEPKSPTFPADWNPKNRWEAAAPYYARNKEIADAINELYCLVASDRKGGTENTIKHARKKGIPIWIHDGIQWVLEFDPEGNSGG